MTKKKYSLSFVNDGKPFNMPKWTVEKHKRVLHKLSKRKKMSEQDKEDFFQYYVIYETLSTIDDSVTLKNIKELHPEDSVLLFNAVYNAGREGILFREGSKPKSKKKKSTGKKN